MVRPVLGSVSVKVSLYQAHHADCGATKGAGAFRLFHPSDSLGVRVKDFCELRACEAK